MKFILIMESQDVYQRRFEIQSGIGENAVALKKAREEIGEYLEQLGYKQTAAKAIVNLQVIEETKTAVVNNDDDDLTDDEFWLPTALIGKVCAYLPFKTVCKMAAVSSYHNQCVQIFFKTLFLKKLRELTGNSTLSIDETVDTKSTNWTLKYAKQYLNRLSSVPVDNLKLNPHSNPD